jgi:hypothetical protein
MSRPSPSLAADSTQLATRPWVSLVISRLKARELKDHRINYGLTPYATLAAGLGTGRLRQRTKKLWLAGRPRGRPVTRGGPVRQLVGTFG